MSVAQTIDYGKAIDDIMADYLSDYPEPTIKALDKLFAGNEIEHLPAETQFFYHYYYGACHRKNNIDLAIKHLTLARNVANSYNEIGIRNQYALDAEMMLADLYIEKGGEDNRAVAMLLYNDIITIGISILANPEIGGLVIQSLIEQAKMGIDVWLDAQWVKQMWIQARDLAIEINDVTSYSYYVISVLKYYCDLDDYDTALSFMNDAMSKEILEVDVASYCKYILETKELLIKDEGLITSKGVQSLDYWSNRLRLAELSVALCSENKSLALLQEVEQGLTENNLTDSYEYAHVLFLLSNVTLNDPQEAESYFLKQVKLLQVSPEYFAYMTEADLFNFLAVCQMKQGKYSEAKANYEKTLSYLERDKVYSEQYGYKNTMAIVFHNFGRNLYLMGKYQESVDYLSKSITIQEEINGAAMRKTEVYLSESINCLGQN